ncbi:ATP-binding protein [Hamadaea tsunoensis]|uniref:ATP-binding protein n=1 Tax=Hamadaea tsunoensis TaxID=53368 RepID=UPI000422A334|nr:ATP-binding protein [Hamadaea tsunoensis]
MRATDTSPDWVFDHGQPRIDGEAPPSGTPGYAVDIDSLAALRTVILRTAEGCGLTPEHRDNLVLAVNELLTNVMRHGGGTGRMWLWPDGGWLYCRVEDHGPGLAQPPGDVGAERPAPSAATGRGLWLIRQFVPRVKIETGGRGTRVTVAMPTVVTP